MSIAIKDWVKVTHDDLPDIKIITEHIDIENLKAFAASPEALKTCRELKKGMPVDRDLGEAESTDNYTGRNTSL